MAELRTRVLNPLGWRTGHRLAMTSPRMPGLSRARTCGTDDEKDG
jgi:hypothetical protein